MQPSNATEAQDKAANAETTVTDVRATPLDALASSPRKRSHRAVRPTNAAPPVAAFDSAL
jgi:hypothetical protein